MFVTINGASLYYEMEGQGRPMILVHGNSEDHTIFGKLAEKLKKDWTLYLLDSRNHGQSEQTELYDYDIMANDLEAFIVNLGLAGANIVGFSDGAILALKLAMKRQELVGRMALLGVNLKPSDLTPEGRKAFEELYEKSPTRLLKMVFDEPNIETDDLKHIQTPTLVAGGENDAVSPETFKKVRDALPHSRMVIVPGHDHLSYVVNTDVFYPELKRFFKEEEEKEKDREKRDKDKKDSHKDKDSRKDKDSHKDKDSQKDKDSHKDKERDKDKKDSHKDKKKDKDKKK
jgi:pimeloyl-ACP methyl ester carboxylesterase